MINHASFVPVEGQSFSSEQDWINRATKALTDHPEYRDTEHPKKKGWQGRHFTTMCFDQKGRRCWNGADFTQFLILREHRLLQKNWKLTKKGLRYLRALSCYKAAEASIREGCT